MPFGSIFSGVKNAVPSLLNLFARFVVKPSSFLKKLPPRSEREDEGMIMPDITIYNKSK